MMFTVYDCEELRRRIKPVTEECGELRHRPFEDTAVNREAMVNLALAYRHLEDASMRLGKAIQALDGGVSVYDKTQVPVA